MDGRINEKVRRICRDINNRADDRKELQILVFRLQEVLRQEGATDQHETRAMKVTALADDPFDKIMVA